MCFICTKQISLPVLFVSYAWLRGTLLAEIHNAYLYNNQINARTLIGQSVMFYCAVKLMEKSRVL